MKFELQLFKELFPLTSPYALSFGTIDTYNTFFVYFKNDEATGLGEITLLEGYGSEGLDGVITAVKDFAESINNKKNVRTTLNKIWSDAPFTSSGIACAIETFLAGGVENYCNPLSAEIPLVAFCPGDTAGDVRKNASVLVDAGYKTLKIKVGRHESRIESDLANAALEMLPPDGKLRLDANQNLSFNEALDLCHRLEDLDSFTKISFLEQPFGVHNWLHHEQLIRNVSLPVMLDESIWDAEDIRRAKDCGANFIKLKLCKHIGIADTLSLMDYAQTLGLGVVFGNGVQTKFGNYLESKIYIESGLVTAFEGNGLLKIAEKSGDKYVVDNGNIIFKKNIQTDDMLTKESMISKFELTMSSAQLGGL